MFTKILKTSIGIILLPLLVSFSVTFYEQFENIGTIWTAAQVYFLWGVVAYCLIQLLLIKPAFLYVLGHESVHVLATWLCLGRVTSFNVSPQGGSVTTSKSNLFISLSPYFVPIYSILLIAAYYILNHIFIWRLFAAKHFLFLLGLTLAFHIAMTVDTLKIRQPDLIKTGYVTSVVFIYTINLIAISGALGIIFQRFSFSVFLKDSYFQSIALYKSIYSQIF
jgi:hypothetical protein